MQSDESNPGLIYVTSFFKSRLSMGGVSFSVDSEQEESHSALAQHKRNLLLN